MARSTMKKQTRTRYTAEYKVEALKLAEKVGFAAAGHELGHDEQLLYNWRKAAAFEESRSLAEQELVDDNVRLKRELAEVREKVALLKNVQHLHGEPAVVKYSFMAG